MTCGRTTGTPRMSAWNCISSSFSHHAAVDAQRMHRNPGIALHRLDHVAGLIRRGLQRRAGDVALAGVARQAGDHAARIAPASTAHTGPENAGTK